MSEASEFQKRLGEDLAQRFDGEFKFFRSSLELRRTATDGTEVIRLAGSNKHSPHVSVAFYFGKRFSTVTALEKRLGLEKMACHIEQYSLNAGQFPGLTYSGDTYWDANVLSNPAKLSTKIHRAIIGIAFPFFSRFADIRTARDALAQDDPWCFGGAVFWNCLLRLDAALGELDHFVQWSERLEPFYAEQAATMLKHLSREP